MTSRRAEGSGKRFTTTPVPESGLFSVASTSMSLLLFNYNSVHWFESFPEFGGGLVTDGPFRPPQAAEHATPESRQALKQLQVRRSELDLLRTELTVEDIVLENSLKVFKRKCSSYHPAHLSAPKDAAPLLQAKDV